MPRTQWSAVCAPSPKHHIPGLPQLLHDAPREVRLAGAGQPGEQQAAPPEAVGHGVFHPLPAAALRRPGLDLRLLVAAPQLLDLLAPVDRRAVGMGQPREPLYRRPELVGQMPRQSVSLVADQSLNPLLQVEDDETKCLSCRVLSVTRAAAGGAAPSSPQPLSPLNSVPSGAPPASSSPPRPAQSSSPQSSSPPSSSSRRRHASRVARQQDL